MTLESIRPSVRFLSQPLLERIVGEARDLLKDLGVEVAHPEVTELLLAGGAKKRHDGRILMTDAMFDKAIETAPSAFSLYDRDGQRTADLGGMRVHFTPGSAAINILDNQSGEIRPPTTDDFVRYVRLVDRLDAIDYQSTAFIPADVHELVSDGYRLYLALLYGQKPVVTGAFTIEAIDWMIDMLLAVRGSEAALADKPLGVFSCCPTAPLKWSDVTSKNVLDCAKYRIPVEYISMPLTGFMAPGTLVGSLVQHTAETLSGLVISQTAQPGTPCLWGGSPAIFDYRFETTPMGAIETQMIDCATNEIGKHLGLPTQAYISLSDSKRLDAQAGFETMSGAVLAALSGINSCSGAGMLDFESCQSLEKLVVDNEIIALAKRLTRGIEVREGEFPSLPHFEEMERDGHLMIADHTRKWIKQEVHLPDTVIDRLNRARYVDEGSHGIEERASNRVEKILKNEPRRLDADRSKALDEIMIRAAKAVGMEKLPAHGV